MILTLVASFTGPSISAIACKRINSVSAGASIVTRVGMAVIDIYPKNIIEYTIFVKNQFRFKDIIFAIRKILYHACSTISVSISFHAHTSVRSDTINTCSSILAWTGFTFVNILNVDNICHNISFENFF